MKLSRTSVGLAVRAAREAARLTLQDLSEATGLTVASLSRSENGQRDMAYAEVMAIADALKIDPEAFRTLAETFERSGAAEHLQQSRSKLEQDLNELQRLAVEAALEALHA
jgi:transcriptional regulator with XRE-family HTH domain